MRVGLSNREAGYLAQHLLDARLVQIPVHLGAWAMHGRAFRPIQHTKLDGGMIRRYATQPTQCVRFTRQGAFANAADAGIAAHFANGRRRRREQHGGRTRSRRGRSSLDTRMPPTDHDRMHAATPHAKEAKVW